MGLANLGSGIKLEPTDTTTNLIFSGLQILVTLIIFVSWVFSLEKFKSLDNISDKPIGIMKQVVSEKTVNRISESAKRTLWLCSRIWLSIILLWFCLYIFMFLYGFGIVDIEEETRDLILRSINHVDTFQFIALYTIFSFSDENIRFSAVIKRNRYFIMFLICLFIIDYVNYFIISDEVLANVLNFLVAIVSSVTFLLFFGRLDSMLLQLEKLLIFIFILYGIFQSTYPLMFANTIVSKEIMLITFGAGLVVSIIGKLGLSHVFCSANKLERLIYYFNGLYFLTPLTKRNFSINHSSYSSINSVKEGR